MWPGQPPALLTINGGQLVWRWLNWFSLRRLPPRKPVAVRRAILLPPPSVCSTCSLHGAVQHQWRQLWAAWRWWGPAARQGHKLRPTTQPSARPGAGSDTRARPLSGHRCSRGQRRGEQWAGGGTASARGRAQGVCGRVLEVLETTHHQGHGERHGAGSRHGRRVRGCRRAQPPRAHHPCMPQKPSAHRRAPGTSLWPASPRIAPHTTRSCMGTSRARSPPRHHHHARRCWAQPP